MSQNFHAFNLLFITNMKRKLQNCVVDVLGMYISKLPLNVSQNEMRTAGDFLF
jgi:hypothetical protein